MSRKKKMPPAPPVKVPTPFHVRVQRAAVKGSRVRWLKAFLPFAQTAWGETRFKSRRGNISLDILMILVAEIQGDQIKLRLETRREGRGVPDCVSHVLVPKGQPMASAIFEMVTAGLDEMHNGYLKVLENRKEIARIRALISEANRERLRLLRLYGC